MTTQIEHDMIIRHEEQLRQLSDLPYAITKLADTVSNLNTAFQVAQTKNNTIAACIGGGCGAIACFGTWIVMWLTK